MKECISLLKQLCTLNGPSGAESPVRDFILSQIEKECDASVDRMGNIIAFKKGIKRPYHKVLLDAHMDEVGVIITDVTETGLLRFAVVGGIEISALLCKRVAFDQVVGVIGSKPIHLSSAAERKVNPTLDQLTIDIGAANKQEALEQIEIGQVGTFVPFYKESGKTTLFAKALDNRVGCAVLIRLLQQPAEYDFYATFTVGEELGLRGAKTAAYTVSPDVAVVLESTTAADLHGVRAEETVCHLGQGVTVPFMDRTTLYPRTLLNKAFDLAKQHNIPIQTKKMVAGGNNAGAVSLTKSGIPTITLATPCRYIHADVALADMLDIKAKKDLALVLLNALARANQ